MQLLTPESGLLFWMLLSFIIVFVILARYGFPVIVKAVEKRRAFIESSVESARKANEQLANIKNECDQLLAEARNRDNDMRREALKEKEQIIDEARDRAAQETQRQVAEATRRIQEEKEKALHEVRGEIANLSVAIAEKVIREKLKKEETQETVINRLIDEMTFSKS